MSIFCLDTQIIRWGLFNQESQTHNAFELVDKARKFIRWLDEKNIEVIVPSIIIGELLSIFPAQEHAKSLQLFSSEWMVVDYDVRAARQYANMRYDHSIKQMMADIKASNPYATRKQLTADLMIIATAKVHGAEKIYSHDKDFLKLAAGYVAIEDFEKTTFQTDFFDKVE